MTTLKHEIDPNINITLEEVRTRIHKWEWQSNVDAYQLGWHYNYVKARDLTKNTSYEDAADFFKKEVKALSQSTLTAYASVARSFTETACIKYGVYNLYTLLTYEKLANITVNGEEPGSTLILVPQEEGPAVEKAFADCSVEDLKQAVKNKRAPPKPMPESLSARVALYRDALERHFTKQSTIRMRARMERDKLILSIQDIPEEKMSKLIEALMDGLNPSSEAA